MLRTCQEILPAKTGEPCTDSAHPCEHPTLCIGKYINVDGGMGTQGTCKIPQVGDTCASAAECPEHFFCNDSHLCAAATAGGPCASSSNCRATEYCGSANTCISRFATDEHCDIGVSDSCLTLNDVCNVFPNDTTPRCHPWVGLGEACSSDDNCYLSFVCRTNVCVPSGPPACA